MDPDFEFYGVSQRKNKKSFSNQMFHYKDETKVFSSLLPFGHWHDLALCDLIYQTSPLSYPLQAAPLECKLDFSLWGKHIKVKVSPEAQLTLKTPTLEPYLAWDHELQKLVL